MTEENYIQYRKFTVMRLVEKEKKNIRLNIVLITALVICAIEFFIIKITDTELWIQGKYFSYPDYQFLPNNLSYVGYILLFLASTIVVLKSEMAKRVCDSWGKFFLYLFVPLYIFFKFFAQFHSSYRYHFFVFLGFMVGISMLKVILSLSNNDRQNHSYTLNVFFISLGFSQIFMLPAYSNSWGSLLDLLDKNGINRLYFIQSSITLAYVFVKENNLNKRIQKNIWLKIFLISTIYFYINQFIETKFIEREVRIRRIDLEVNFYRLFFEYIFTNFYIYTCMKILFATSFLKIFLNLSPLSESQASETP